jgi:hypothetical protein
MDEKSFPLVRSLFGFGNQYKWPVAALALIGGALSWFFRYKMFQFWRVFLLMVLCTLFLYGFLALYFFRSSVYTMLTLPLIMTVAGVTLTVLFQNLASGVKSLKVVLLWAPVALPLIFLFPMLLDNGILKGEEPFKPPVVMKAFKAADGLLEEDAVLLGGANPLLGQYLYAQSSKRKYLYLSQEPGPFFDRFIYRELGTEEITQDAVAGYVEKLLSEGIPVYLLRLPAYFPQNASFLQHTFKLLKKRFRMEPLEMRTLLRIEGKKSEDKHFD